MALNLAYATYTKTRKAMDINGMWRFRLDKNSEGRQKNWMNGIPKADLIPVPSSFNDLFTDKESREFTGSIWYETDIYVPQEWKGLDISLRFSSVTSKATVFVNGIKVKEHHGGYTPFHAPVDTVIDFDRKNKIVVEVSNLLDDITLPRGETATKKDGTRLAKSDVDFYHYAGIQRSVKLIAMPKERVTDFSVRFDLEGKDAAVSYQAETNGKSEVRLEVYDENDNFVAETIGKNNKLTVKDVQLWKPLKPYLYTFIVKICDGEHVIDMHREKIGIRTVEVKGQQLFINNEPVYLKGFYKWEDSELHGAGVNPAILKRDVELMKWAGANVISTADFPHSEELYELADREGFLLIDTLPASGLKNSKPSFHQMMMGIKEDGPFFARDVIQEEMKVHHRAVMEEVIQRDKNHACVIAWNLMTEPDATDEHITNYAKDIFDYAHELDPQKRPRTALLPMNTKMEDSKINDLCDIISLHRKDGWDEMGGYELSDAETEMKETLASWEAIGKPVFITSEAAESVSGEWKLPSVQWSEPYQVESLEMQQQMLEELPFIIGEQVHFADIQAKEGLTAIDTHRSGVFTRNRQPKMAAYLVRERWRTK
ncbi:beta-glucuronidase [Virgibacillus xinjiangensis]|uniref:Beta-glucuronidase n=1 Tax=Virgibacillus xinjiangensis TaxID=393090 RepID=A0ABV7CS19_9BACI